MKLDGPVSGQTGGFSSKIAVVCGLYPVGRAGRDTRRSSSKNRAEIIEQAGRMRVNDGKQRVEKLS
jgi:hypothetical protein